jgi:flagellar basal body-associated protein FliL
MVMDKKAMSTPITIVVAIVVLLITALILITLVSTNVIKFSGNSDSSITDTSKSIKCQTELASGCQGLKSGVDTCPAEKCKSCPTGTKCP